MAHASLVELVSNSDPNRARDWGFAAPDAPPNPIFHTNAPPAGRRACPWSADCHVTLDITTRA